MMSNNDDDMEEGELSDDGMDLPKILERPPKMGVLPDLLKEISGADFNTVDPENVQKISARAIRFQTGKAISFQEISSLYRSLEVSHDQSDENQLNRLEMIHVWSQEKVDLEDIQRFFSDYHPLNVEQVGRNKANIIWATAANCARAMLAVSKGIGEAGTERVIKHVLDEEEEMSVVTETETGEDLVHPEDIGIEMPDGGPWRLGKRAEEEGVLLLRFGRKTDISIQERRITARNVGILSKSKREELVFEQQKATQRELEMKKPVDKKNPWGIVAERWAGESRGQTGRVFDDYMDSLDKGLPHGAQSRRRDWDAPEETELGRRMPSKGKGSIRDRLDFGNRVEQDSDDQTDAAREAEEEEIDWATKMKRPRMGMVADLVEKKGSAKSRLYGSDMEQKEIIKRKVPNIRFEREEADEEEGVGSSVFHRVDTEERVFKTAGRRLTDRFMGGRLEGRVGLGKADDEMKQVGKRMEGRLGSKFAARLGAKNDDSDSGDSLERDTGADFQHNLESDLVIQVTQSDEETFEPKGRDERSGIRNESIRSEGGLEIEQRSRRNDREHQNYRLQEKEARDRKKIRALKEREEQLIREKRRNERRDRERDNEEYLRRKEKEKKRSKNKYSSDDDSDSDSEESGSESSDSSDSESDSTGSESESSSSDSQEEIKKKKNKQKVAAKRLKGESKKYRTGGSSSKSHKEPSKSDSKKKSNRKDSAEDMRKAEELRDKLKNYLMKAKEAKKNKKK